MHGDDEKYPAQNSQIACEHVRRRVLCAAVFGGYHTKLQLGLSKKAEGTCATVYIVF